MNRRVAAIAGAGWIICLAVVLGFSLPSSAQDQALSAQEILDKVDDLYRGESSHGKMSMTIVTAHWTRTLRLEFWNKGKDKSLIRILAPEKEAGTATLRVGNEIWNYLPKVNRVIKLPSSMMSASWMGSHFTNNDLVKESRFTEDYTFEKGFEGAREGVQVIEIDCRPKPEAAVVWGRVAVAVRQGDYLPLESKYYDEDLNLARTMTFSRIQEMTGRTMPTVMTVVPADKPEEKTVVDYEEIAFDLDLSDEVFSLRQLKK